MEDLIRRSDAIDALNAEFSITGKENARTVLNYLDLVKTRIKAIPSADRWIPCSERLPKEGETVLVQFNVKGHRFPWEEQRYIEFGRISSDREDAKGIGWEWLNESGADYWEPDYGNLIVAWMPLPKPWKGADDELSAK